MFPESFATATRTPSSAFCPSCDRPMNILLNSDPNGMRCGVDAGGRRRNVPGVSPTHQAGAAAPLAGAEETDARALFKALAEIAGPGLSVRAGNSTPACTIIRRPAESSDGEGLVALPLCSRSGDGRSTCAFAAAAGPMECRCGDRGRYPFRDLPFQMACTLARVLAAFSVAFTLGVIAGYAMGRWKTVDRYADSWLIVLLIFLRWSSSSLPMSGSVSTRPRRSSRWR